MDTANTFLTTSRYGELQTNAPATMSVMETWVDELLADSGPAGQLIRWNPASWSAVAELDFPNSAETLRLLAATDRWTGPEQPALSRQDVRDAADQLGAHAGFLAALVWGFGPTGYGASRVAKMLATPGARETAETIWMTAREQGAEAGFTSLWRDGRSRIRGLGTAFGTKVLYFAGTGATPGPAPLVLDQFVYHGAHRLAENGMIADAGRVPDPRRYLASDTYSDYCAWADKQAPGAGDTVEYVLFQTGKA